MINILIREFALKQTVADQNALEQFQKQWSTYQKLVDADALSHRAVSQGGAFVRHGRTPL
jgi:hypothetical protein